MKTTQTKSARGTEHIRMGLAVGLFVAGSLTAAIVAVSALVSICRL